MADTLVIRIDGNIKAYQDSLKAISSETKNLEDQLTSIAKKSAIAFVGLTAAIVGTVSAAAKIETMTTQFEVLTGSVDQAKKTVKDLQDFSAKTPFQLAGIGKAAAQLIGFGVSNDELIGKLGRLGDVAAAANASIEDLAIPYGRMRAENRLTLVELDKFSDRGINVYKALAEASGRSITTIRSDISNGKLSFKDFETALVDMTEKGGIAFGGMSKQSETMAGKISTLKDNFALFSADIGKEFLPMFKKMATAATEGLQFLRRNPEIAKTAATLLTIGVAITGLVTVFATAGIAFLKLRSIIKLTTLAMKKMTFSIRGMVGATGIGLLVIVLTDLAVNWEKRFAQMQAIFHAFAKNLTNIGQGLGKFLTGVFTLDIDKIKEGYSQIKDTVISTFDEIANDPSFSDPEKAPINKFFPTPEEVTEKAEASTDAVLTAKLAQFDAIVEQDAELKEMLDELKAEEREATRLALATELQTESEMRAEAIKARLIMQKKANKQFLKDQKEFGKTFAMINQFMHSEVFKGTKSAFGNLTKLTQSKNKTLKGIGKIAATANIIIQTAQSAMAIFAGFSTIPVVGPALGFAGAAAAVAFGGEQIGNVQRANKGLLVSGGIPGVDSVNVLAQQNELISPAQNFEEVIGSVRAKREAESLGGEGGVTGGGVGIHVTYDSPEASQIITVRQVEDTALGISRDSFKEAA